MGTEIINDRLLIALFDGISHIPDLAQLTPSSARLADALSDRTLHSKLSDFAFF